MSELHDPDLRAFEAELRKVQAAPAPEALLNRLIAARPTSQPVAVKPVHSEPRAYDWLRLLRWLAPATALGAVVVITLGRYHLPGVSGQANNLQQAQAGSVPLPSPIKDERADEIEIGRTLVATFDAVAEMPSGEPVRFRCQQWADTTIFRDRARGIAVERSAPRLEIVPVSLDTY